MRHLISAIALTLVVVLWHPFLGERALLGQVGERPLSGQGRGLTVAPTTLNDVRDWDNTINSMVRTDELRVRQERADTLVVGRSIERLAQYYRGVRVWGGDISRQLDGASAVSAFGTVYEGLDFDVTPILDRDDAVTRLESVGGPLLMPATEPELVILPDDRGAFRLTWMATVRTRRDVVRFFIDARTGHVVGRYGRLQRQTANVAVGSGFGVLGDIKKVSATSFAGTFILSDPLRPPALVTYDLRGDIVRALGVLFDGIPLSIADIAANGSNNWTDSAVVDAHAYSGYTYDYYYKRFGRRGLDDDNRPLLSIVHAVKRSDIYGMPDWVFDQYYLNAFYCSECAGGVMVYGEGLPGGEYLPWNGERTDFLAGALDVVAHELTHGVTNHSSQLEYVNESGALNEAFSDIMGTSVEFFFHKPGNGHLQPDYLIGEDVVKCCNWNFGEQDGIRSMADPASFNQPDHYSKLVLLPPTPEGDNGGVHINSGIPNHAFYLTIEGGRNRTSGITVQGVGAANREQIEKLFYRAFVQLMPSNANFSMARMVTLRAAEDLYGQNSAPYIAVRDAWTAVGVN